MYGKGYHNAAEPTSSLGFTGPVKGGVVTHPLREMHPGNTIVASMITLSLRRSPTNAASL